MASLVKSALRALGDKSEQPAPAASVAAKHTAADVLHDIKEDIKDIPKAFDRGRIIGQLSSEEKIALLSGDDTWHTVPVPRLGIPRVRVRPLSADLHLRLLTVSSAVMVR